MCMINSNIPEENYLIKYKKEELIDCGNLLMIEQVFGNAPR